MTEKILDRLAQLFDANATDQNLPTMLGKVVFLHLAGRVMSWRRALKLPQLSQAQRGLLSPLDQFPVQQFLQALQTLLQEFPELAQGLPPLWAAQMQDRDTILATILRIADSIRARTTGRRQLCIDGLVRTTDAVDQAADEALADPAVPKEERDAIALTRKPVEASDASQTSHENSRKGRRKRLKGQFTSELEGETQQRAVRQARQRLLQEAPSLLDPPPAAGPAGKTKKSKTKTTPKAKKGA